MSVVIAIEAELASVDARLEELAARRGGLAALLDQARSLEGGAASAPASTGRPPRKAPKSGGTPAPPLTAKLANERRAAWRAARTGPRAGEAPRGAMSDPRRAVLAAVAGAAGAWVSTRDVVEATGSSATAASTHLQRLVRDGIVEATGSTRSRRYRVEPRPAAADARPDDDVPVDETEIRRNARAEITAALEARGGTARMSELAEAVSFGRGQLTTHLSAMHAADLVRQTGGHGTPWQLVPTATAAAAQDAQAAKDTPHRRSHQKLPTRVLEAIEADPGALTEERLALALDVHREQIADTCGALLLEDQIAMNPDRTYSPAAASAAA